MIEMAEGAVRDVALMGASQRRSGRADGRNKSLLQHNECLTKLCTSATDGGIPGNPLSPFSKAGPLTRKVTTADDAVISSPSGFRGVQRKNQVANAARVPC